MNWGMLPPDLQSATKIDVREAKQSDGHVNRRFGAPKMVFNGYEIRSFSFDGALYFDNSGLSAIQLSSNQPGACSMVDQTLRAQYGKPDRGEANTNVYLDDMHKNRIEVFDMPSISACDIQYTPVSAF